MPNSGGMHFMANEIIPINRGLGNWQFEIYTPNKLKGPYKGYLLITKEHHVVFEDANLQKTIVNIASQNVSSVEKMP